MKYVIPNIALSIKKALVKKWNAMFKLLGKWIPNWKLSKAKFSYNISRLWWMNKTIIIIKQQE